MVSIAYTILAADEHDFDMGVAPVSRLPASVSEARIRRTYAMSAASASSTGAPLLFIWKD